MPRRALLTIVVPITLACITSLWIPYSGETNDGSPSLDGAVEITNGAGQSTRIDDKQLKALARRKVEIKDPTGKSAVYEGVVLATLLEKAEIKLEKELRGTRMANYLLVEAKDGYRVVFALPEVDPTMSDNLILFADLKDGKALDENEGPYRIIVPHEKHHSQWFRQVPRVSEPSATTAK